MVVCKRFHLYYKTPSRFLQGALSRFSPGGIFIFLGTLSKHRTLASGKTACLCKTVGSHKAHGKGACQQSQRHDHQHHREDGLVLLCAAGLFLVGSTFAARAVLRAGAAFGAALAAGAAAAPGCTPCRALRAAGRLFLLGCRAGRSHRLLCPAAGQIFLSLVVIPRQLVLAQGGARIALLQAFDRLVEQNGSLRGIRVVGGMGRLVAENCDFLLSIPMRGKVSSLNASAAASVVMYEVLRQRQVK